jgi:hypothetical protein
VIGTDGQDVRIATRYPYGRDALDRLICETAGTPNTRWNHWTRQQRTVPCFEFGHDEDNALIHYVIAGEDCWETAGCWTADAIVRQLAGGSEAAESLLGRARIRVAPLASPYSATQPGASYTTPDGKGIYGAATWGDDEPPPEYAAIRADVQDTVRRHRLGLMMTLHSWQAQQETTQLQTIRTAGSNALDERRTAWATDTMTSLIDGVPYGVTKLSEKIWHPGLARDYLLATHNVITFRTEVTTAGQGYDGFRETGHRFLRNLAAIDDWTPVYAVADST